MKTNSMTARLVAAALVATLAVSPVAAEAGDSQTKEAGSDFGIGVVTVFANFVYMPVKLVYGVLGGITGGFAYVLSGAKREVADGVWVPSLGGDYVLTTEMMKGEEPVHFNGIRARRTRTVDSDAPFPDDTAGSTF